MSDPRIGLLLALADDELILGHRLSEWTGWVPYIEEDLALSSIAQDEMAHARALYAIVTDLDGRDEDTLALGREPAAYRNAIICERPNRDYAYTLARHWLYDHADAVRLRALASSAIEPLRDAVAVFSLEERYHLDHADAWFRRVADGPIEARQRLADALRDALPEAVGIFEPLPDEAALIDDGSLPRAHAELLAEWLEGIGERLIAHGLDHIVEDLPAGEMIPTSSGAIEDPDAEPLGMPGLSMRDERLVHVGAFTGAGGRSGVHSPDFESLWSEMTGLYRAHPGASW